MLRDLENKAKDQEHFQHKLDDRQSLLD